MTVTFQVGDREFGGSGNLDVDFWVCMLSKSLGLGEISADWIEEVEGMDRRRQQAAASGRTIWITSLYNC